VEFILPITFASFKWAWNSCDLHAIEQAQEFRLDMITLSSNISHTLYPLDELVASSFQNNFQKKEIWLITIT
jgi:hypothetical protein